MPAQTIVSELLKIIQQEITESTGEDFRCFGNLVPETGQFLRSEVEESALNQTSQRADFSLRSRSFYETAVAEGSK